LVEPVETSQPDLDKLDQRVVAPATERIPENPE